jgi:hypothetical protein
MAAMYLISLTTGQMKQVQWLVNKHHQG